MLRSRFPRFSDLTATFCSVRVWNQFQQCSRLIWSLVEVSGVCDEKTVGFVFWLDD